MGSLPREAARTSGPSLRVEGLALDLGAQRILHDIDLAVEPGELLALIGPSGSGKSSLLRCLAGFVAPNSGRICFGERAVATSASSVPPERRRIGFVFQSHALFPHLSARDNVAYPWKVRGVATAERRARADGLLERVGLGALGDRRPARLSGGERQRVALARALAGEPEILLLDEPFASVDVMIRDELLRLVRDLVDESGLTTVFTTHDQQEAMTLADRTAVLVAGRLVQVGTPRAVYERPVTSFVARFMGASNLLRVRIVGRRADSVVVRLVPPANLGRDGAALAPVELTLSAAAPAGDDAVLVARPEDLRLERLGDASIPPGAERDRLEGRVWRTIERGRSSEVLVDAAGFRFEALDPTGGSWPRGSAVGLRLKSCLLLSS